MGGYGSGRPLWPLRKDTVEDCIAIDISWLKRNHYLHPGRHTAGSLRWSQGRESAGSIGFEARLDLTPPFIRLHYTINRTEKIDYRVDLATTQPNYAGIRWWFICPNRKCGRRVGKLYSAPGSKYFLCRTCQDLTYTSCQDSHKFDRLLPAIARESGMSIEEAKEALRRGELFT